MCPSRAARSRAPGAEALKVTPEGVKRTVQLPEPEPGATEAIGKRSAAFAGFCIKAWGGMGEARLGFCYSSFWVSL